MLVFQRRTTMSRNPYKLPLICSREEYRARVATDPDQQLVDLADWVPGLVLDLRYATANNLAGRPLYTRAQALARRPVAVALARVQHQLAAFGVGLVVYDAYRPYHVTREFYELIGDEDFAAPPWRGSRHNRGCALDVGLVQLGSGQTLPLPTDFDELTPAAHARYPALPAHVLFNRSLLLAAMRGQGFRNYPAEWWHFDHPRWPEFDLLDLSFEELVI
ncbi:M15 family metallopeptidase [Hymenobacter psychrophilus]|uniref:D-alanyl-D-alanine dipeptidase n=1 Tax=Hymenobacter psychrophilus TaxID=651662 RepID=A0A1H3GRI6_9BACT|nr:M15 family metallopeptidase [Hymenobacter psychrophilus]SDY05575.1 D-alanyl-D-alanine dipeptidase [Hymenobacter psychrophilus]